MTIRAFTNVFKASKVGNFATVLVAIAFWLPVLIGYITRPTFRCSVVSARDARCIFIAAFKLTFAGDCSYHIIS